MVSGRERSVGAATTSCAFGALGGTSGRLEHNLPIFIEMKLLFEYSVITSDVPDDKQKTGF